MKLDHFVVNVDQKYQNDSKIVSEINAYGFPYVPKNGKGTKGFKVSNLWIGTEYLEMVHILQEDGGGWVAEWTKKSLAGHRGMICLMLDVKHMDELYNTLIKQQIAVTRPEWLEFKWFFNLFTRRMPWRNFYIPFFAGVPFQIGFQEMKDEKSRKLMDQYMEPNAREHGINGITSATITGQYTMSDFAMIQTVFNDYIVQMDEVCIVLEFANNQQLRFVKGEAYQVDLQTTSKQNTHFSIENLNIHY